LRHAETFGDLPLRQPLTSKHSRKICAIYQGGRLWPSRSLGGLAMPVPADLEQRVRAYLTEHPEVPRDAAVAAIAKDGAKRAF
jgi:hypothetical protein